MVAGNGRERLNYGLLSYKFGIIVALLFFMETVAKVNSLTILLARLSRLCRKDEAQGAEGEA